MILASYSPGGIKLRIKLRCCLSITWNKRIYDWTIYNSTHSVEFGMPTPAGLLVMLWTRPLTFWPQKLTCSYPCPKVHQRWKFGEIQSSNFQDVALTRRTHRDLELWPFYPKTWSFHSSHKMHQCWKFGENMSNTFQDIVLTTFGTHGETDSQTHEQPENIMLPAALWSRRHNDKTEITIACCVHAAAW